MQKITRKNKKFHKKFNKKNKTQQNKYRNTKIKKSNTKYNKTRKNKKSSKNYRVYNRKKLHGGMNDLGKIFLELAKNKKIYEEEGLKNDAQSNTYEQAGWKIEELTGELREKINDDVKFDEVMKLLEDYESSKNMYESEIKANKMRDKQDSQGEYWAQNEHSILLNTLNEEYGVDVIDNL
jgi:hypothetical protein